MNAIEVNNLVKSYPMGWGKGNVVALSGVSLAVSQGEVFGFIGANGAGKSTTIKILTGAMQPTSGDVKLFGIAASNSVCRSGMGYVPENPSLPSYLTPLEILQGAMSLHRVKEANTKEYCIEWLARFQIDHVATKTIRNFSKGMAQRVALAHALCIRPKLLILDEPLSGLDPVGRRDVVEILAEYKRQGGTIFLTSHVLHDIERLADRFGLIHQGRLVMVKSPKELAEEEQFVMIRSLGNCAIEGFTNEGGGRWASKVASKDVWQVMHALETAGHVLIEVRPTLSLENVFLKAVGKA